MLSKVQERGQDADSTIDVEKGRLSHAIASFGPPADDWARERPITAVTGLSLTFADSGDKTKSSPTALLVDVALTVNLGSSLGIFGGTELARRRLLAILAVREALDQAQYQLIGHTKDGSMARSHAEQLRFGYVHKGNSLYPAATPSEEIRLNLALRFPDVARDELARRASALLSATALDKVEDKPCMALTPGQRKLLAIALEMTGDPDVLVLDEPFASIHGDGQAQQKLQVATVIAHIASSKRCLVVYTAAECDAVVFETAHDVMILSQGAPTSVIFHPASKAEVQSTLGPGAKIWKTANPVEAIILSSKFVENGAQPQALNAPRQLVGSASFDSAANPIGTRSSPGILADIKKFVALTKREFGFTKRDPRLLKGRMISAIVVNAFCACIFLYTADQSQTNYNPGSHIASMILILFMNGIGALIVNSILVQDIRPAILREMSHGLARPVTIFAARMVPELLLNFAVAIVIVLIMYWSARWSASFMYFVGVLFLFLEVCVSYSHVVGFVAPSPTVAIGLSVVLMIPQLFFMGIFVRIHFLPVFVEWITYLCSISYAIRLLLTEELNLSQCKSPANCAQWAGFMTTNGMVKADQWWYAIVLALAFFLGTRLLALLLAFRKEKHLVLKGRDSQ